MDGALYLMKADGSEQKLLVKKLFWDSNHKDNTVQPEWSPDSKWLVYHRCVGRTSPISNCTIYKVNIETGIEVKLAEGGMFPSWRNR
jgi:Tol biopolymer transport system component